ncbi:MAG: site-specific integrase [Pseudonocardiaceae bacterium]
MRVQRVLMPDSEFESWTLLGDDHVPVEPVERFLAYLASIERSPNTIKAYAHDLKDWFTYLDGHGVDCGRSRTLTSAGGSRGGRVVIWTALVSRPGTRSGLSCVGCVPNRGCR